MKRHNIITIFLVIQVGGQFPNEDYYDNCLSIEMTDLQLNNLSDRSLNTLSLSDEGRNSGGLLVIIPAMKFNCCGSVRSWSGLVAVGNSPIHSQTMSLTHVIHFQVWRPTNKEGTFNLVGSDLIVFDSMDMSDDAFEQSETELDKNRRNYYNFTRQLGNDGNKTKEIHFQPGDVIGCYIPTNLPATMRSLGFVFRNASRTDEKKVDLFVFSVPGPLICEASSCDESLNIVSWVVPLVYPQYDVFSEEDIEMGYSICNSTNSNTTPSNKVCNGVSKCPIKETQNSVIPASLAVIAAACIVLLCLIAMTTNMVIICIARRKNKRRKEDMNLVRENRLAARNLLHGYVEPTHISSLAEFLQYSMQRDPCNVSWV